MHIQLEKITVSPAECLSALHGAKGALVLAAGIGVRDKRALENRFQDAADGMMNHPVPKVGGADHALLGIVNLKCAVGPRLVGLCQKFSLDRDHLVFNISQKQKKTRQ